MNEIYCRKQGKDEKVTHFLADLENMMQNLSVPLSSRRQVKIALQNLRPRNRYYMEDHYVDSWSDLEYYGRKLDRRSERNGSVYSSDAMLEPHHAVIVPPMLSSSCTTSTCNSDPVERC